MTLTGRASLVNELYGPCSFYLSVGGREGVMTLGKGGGRKEEEEEEGRKDSLILSVWGTLKGLPPSVVLVGGTTTDSPKEPSTTENQHTTASVQCCAHTKT